MRGDVENYVRVGRVHNALQLLPNAVGRRAGKSDEQVLPNVLCPPALGAPDGYEAVSVQIVPDCAVL